MSDEADQSMPGGSDDAHSSAPDDASSSSRGTPDTAGEGGVSGDADETSGAAISAREASDDGERTTSSDTGASSKGSTGWGARLWWALPVLLIVEFYFFGHDGRLQVCVGKEGDTDFSLVGQERTDENRWKFPRCETRLNVGLRSRRDEQVKDAVTVACRGATIFRHQGEAKPCVAAEDGWKHEVEGSFVPPWDPDYYNQLFWFLQ